MISLFRSCVALLIPRSCLICDRPRAYPICISCLPIRPQPTSRCDRCFRPSSAFLCPICSFTCPPFKRMRSYGWYSGELQALITTMKFRPSKQLCCEAAKLLSSIVKHYKGDFDRWDTIVPMPASRLTSRGFNHMLVIAKVLQQDLNIPVINLLQREDSQSQQKKRRKRIPFGLLETKIRPRHVLLIDDTITTGASILSGAQTLLDHDITCDVMTLAISQKWYDNLSRARTKIDIRYLP